MSLVEHSTWISWAPPCTDVPKAFAELPGRQWLRSTREARAVTGVRESFKAKQHLLFQPQHYKLLHTTSNYPFSQSKLLSALVLGLHFFTSCGAYLWITALTPLASKAPVGEPLPFCHYKCITFQQVLNINEDKKTHWGQGSRK